MGVAIRLLRHSPACSQHLVLGPRKVASGWPLHRPQRACKRCWSPSALRPEWSHRSPLQVTAHSGSSDEAQGPTSSLQDSSLVDPHAPVDPFATISGEQSVWTAISEPVVLSDEELSGSDGSEASASESSESEEDAPPAEDATTADAAPRPKPENAETDRARQGSTMLWAKRPSWWNWPGLANARGRLLYNYYNWRRGTWSDLQLLAALNLGLLVLGALVKAVAVDHVDSFTPVAGNIWLALYEILEVVLGQELPAETSEVQGQLFALSVATVGLAAFALVLALVEQVVLEVIDDNVRRGSPVYEKRHILLLAWGDNQKDLEVIWKILNQVCLAYRNEGGRVVVVLCAREKLRMEDHFRRVIPVSQRYGTTFVFRQGNPLLPSDLALVASDSAAATVIISDSSRYPLEADALAVRVAVLLDEMEGGAGGRKGHIILEIKTSNALPLVKFSCSPRIVALPTTQLNARRMARMVRMPMVGMINHSLWRFDSQSQAYISPFPELKGKTFGEAQLSFADGLVFGVVNPSQQRCLLNPSADMVLQEGDELAIARPSSIPARDYKPLPHPVEADPGDWRPEDYANQDPSIGSNAGYSALTSGSAFPGSTAYSLATASLVNATALDNSVYMQESQVAEEPQRVLICGWGETSFMCSLIRELDRGAAAFPKGSEVVLFNRMERAAVLGPIQERAQPQRLSVLHVQGNPMFQADLAKKIEISKYDCAIALCDISWQDPDMQVANGISASEQADMLRLDSMVMMVQLNIRRQLEEEGCPPINIVAEKVAFEGVTRFEDRLRLPLGMSVNLTSYSAKMLAQMMYNPQVILLFSHLGAKHELRVQDSSAFADVGEELTYWQLMRRAQLVRQVLVGWYITPEGAEKPLDYTVNPRPDLRSRKRIWNNGENRVKLFTLAAKVETAPTLEEGAATWDVGSGPDSSTDENDMLLDWSSRDGDAAWQELEQDVRDAATRADQTSFADLDEVSREWAPTTVPASPASITSESGSDTNASSDGSSGGGGSSLPELIQRVVALASGSSLDGSRDEVSDGSRDEGDKVEGGGKEMAAAAAAIVAVAAAEAVPKPSEFGSWADGGRAQSGDAASSSRADSGNGGAGNDSNGNGGAAMQNGNGTALQSGSGTETREDQAAAMRQRPRQK